MILSLETFLLMGIVGFAVAYTTLCAVRAIRRVADRGCGGRCSCEVVRLPDHESADPTCSAELRTSQRKEYHTESR